MINKHAISGRICEIGAAILLAVGFAPAANAVQIDFTGGTVFLNDGSTVVTNNSLFVQNVSHYEEGGFRLEFIFSVSTPDDFSSIVGDYYSTGNDVIHGHWSENGNQLSGPFGQVDEIRVSKIDGTTFDLGGFRVSTNTAIGGSSADGSEMTWINSSKASEIFLVTPDSWGLGSGPDPLISIDPNNSLFNDITWFSFTNDPESTAVGLGLDNFFLDEPGDPAGEDPTPDMRPDPTGVPEPGTLGLLLTGLLAFGLGRRQRAS